MNQAAARIAVIGGGWAGLTSARLLHDQGFSVTIFEASRQAGGRARALEITLGGETYKLDNGQHLIVGAYRCFRAMLEHYGDTSHAAFEAPAFHMLQWTEKSPSHQAIQSKAHVKENMRLRHMKLAQSPSLRSLQESMIKDTGSVAAWRKRFAINLSKIAWLLGAKRIPIRSLFELAHLMQQAKIGGPSAAMTVAVWLEALNLRDKLVKQWLAALCESALNCPPEEGCANRFVTVINEAMANPHPVSSSWLQQDCDLGELFVDPLLRGSESPRIKHDASLHSCKRLPLDCRYGARVVGFVSKPAQSEIAVGGQQWWLRLAGSFEPEGPFEQVILALDPRSAARIAHDSLGEEGLVSATMGSLIESINTLPKPLGILTRWLLLPAASRAMNQDKRSLPTLLLGDEGPPAWIFPRQGLRSDNRHPSDKGHQVAGLVISAQTDPQIARLHADSIQERFAIGSSDYQDIYEHQAASPSTAGTKWPRFDQFGDLGLWLSGDWVDDCSGLTLPASLESTLRSAYACAGAIASFGGRKLDIDFSIR